MLKLFTNYRLWIVVWAALAAVIILPHQVYAATVTVDLCATEGTMTMPDGANITIWGYAMGNCSGTPAPTLPGPVIRAAVGDTVEVTLHNNLNEASAMVFTGQEIVPDFTGAAKNGGTQFYRFAATSAGTFLYEAGPLAANSHPGAEYQTAMGLYGPLIIDPTTNGRAYNDASSAYDVEAIALLSEIDPALHNNPTNFDLRNYKPKYWLINGKAYPETTEINAAAGNRVLIRYINAGLQHHSMALLGIDQTVIATDGNPFTFSHRMVAETVPPGQTADVISTVSQTTIDGSKFPLYDGNLLLHNSNTAGFGGMLTFLNVGPASGGTTSAPETTSVTVTPNPTNGVVDVALTASISDADGTVAAAEYFIDTIGATGTAMSGSFNAGTVSVNATISSATLAGLAAGNHPIYVRGRDNDGNWGPTNFVVLNLDKAGPTTSGLVVTPNVSDGSQDIALSGTADDSATGNSNVVAFAYAIDGGTEVNVVVTAGLPVVSLNATIAAATVGALADGTHTVAVRSQDAFGNWGGPVTVDLLIDRSGPTTSDVRVQPSPNNGTISFSTGQPVVRVDALIAEAATQAAGDTAAALSTKADADDAESELNIHLFVPLIMDDSSGASRAEVVVAAVPHIQKAEGFIDTVGANGSGFPLDAVDGSFDTTSEAVYGLIPLATVLQMSDGSHNIYVHGQDAAGNWGATASAVLVVDKTAPTLSAISVTPNPTNGATAVALVATGTDATTPVVAAEWFVDTDPGDGNATPMTVNGAGAGNLTATIDVSTWTSGDHTISVRAQDTVGNWSAIGTTVLTVSGTQSGLLLRFSTFGSGAVPGVGTPYDDSDIYARTDTGFVRELDMTAAGLPAGQSVDGLAWVSPTDFYISLAGNWNFPGPGSAQDEDVLHYNNGTWSVYFDGTAHNLTGSSQDIDALDIVGGVLYFSTLGNGTVQGVGGPNDDADIYAWNGTSFSRIFDASANGLPGAADIDALDVVDTNHFYVSFNASNLAVPNLGTVQDEDVLYYDNGTWSVYFDGTAAGLTAGTLDVDAIDIP